MNLPFHSSRRGQTLVEALVALSILTAGFVGIATLLTKSFQLNRTTMYDTQGTYLAAEGIELAKNLIDHDVYAGLAISPSTDYFGNCFPQSGYYYPIDYTTTDCSSSSLHYQASPPNGIHATLYFNPTTHLFSFDSLGSIPTNFLRTIQVIPENDPATGKLVDLDVQSKVTWADSGISNSVTLEDHFYNLHPTQSSGGTSGGTGGGGTGGGGTGGGGTGGGGTGGGGTGGGGTGGGNPLIPSNAIAASNLDDYPTSVYCPNTTGNNGVTDYQKWICNHDPGTPGNSLGASTLVTNPSTDGQARKFYDTYTGNGGEIYHLAFANDPNATHFVYDAEVYLADPASVANLEMDMNQGMPITGHLVIYGTQCASGSGTWEYTYSGGWHASNIPCNPTTWSVGWHHVQIASHRDSTGNVTYDWVDLDGNVQYFNNAQSGPPRSSVWTPGTLLINFQLDGKGGSGAITAYADQITVWRW